MIVVHHLDDSRSRRILWLLEELGAPYEIKQLSFAGEPAAARFSIAGYPRIVGWAKRFQARPAFKAALARAAPYSFAS